MRQPKFRGYSLETNNWHYGHGWFEVDYTEEYKQEKGIEDKAILYIDGRSPIECELTSMGEFTGLLDANGDEIYEGDILEGTSYLYDYQLNNGNQFDYKGYVEWGSQCDTGLCWLLSDDNGSWELKQTVHRNDIDYSTGVIRGNIYEMPDWDF